MVTRHRRRGHSPRYTGDVGEPETEAHLRAERKVRIQSPPARSLVSPVPSAAADPLSLASSLRARLLVKPDRPEILIEEMARTDLPALDIGTVGHDPVPPQGHDLVRRSADARRRNGFFASHLGHRRSFRTQTGRAVLSACLTFISVVAGARSVTSRV